MFLLSTSTLSGEDSGSQSLHESAVATTTNCISSAFFGTIPKENWSPYCSREKLLDSPPGVSLGSRTWTKTDRMSSPRSLCTVTKALVGERWQPGANASSNPNTGVHRPEQFIQSP